MTKKNKGDWAIRLVQGIEKVERKARQDRRADADYWNGDSWGSISGTRDANNWIDEQKAKYVRRFMRRILKRGKDAKKITRVESIPF